MAETQWNRIYLSIRLGLLLCFKILSLFPGFLFWVFSSFAPSPFLVSKALSLTSEVPHLPVLPLGSASNHDTLPASVLNNHISPLGYDALILRHNHPHSSHLSQSMSGLNPFSSKQRFAFAPHRQLAKIWLHELIHHLPAESLSQNPGQP